MPELIRNIGIHLCVRCVCGLSLLLLLDDMVLKFTFVNAKE